MNIEAKLKQLAIFPNNSGYYLILEIVRMIMEDNSSNSMRYYYDILAKKYNCTACNIEKKISWAIEKGIMRAAKEYYKVFGMSINAEKGKPTNKQFIYTLIVGK